MTASQPARAPLAAAMLAAGLVSATAASAAGFAIAERSAAGLGNAYAGASATAEDASTIAFNPAGLAHLARRQLVLVGHVIAPRSKLEAGATVTRPTSPPTTVGGGLGGDAGVTAFVPNLYGALPLGDAVVAGIGVYAPFGLATRYDRNWAGRYHAVESDLKTVSVVPSVAVRAGERLALGVGLNIQYAKARLTNAIDFSALGAGDGFADIRGDSWSWGLNAGMIYGLGGGARVGIAYRSRVFHRLEGKADFSDIPPPVLASGRFVDTDASARVELPESLSLSLAVPHGRWTFLADASWTNWSRFERLVVNYAQGAQGPTVTEERWQSSWRFSLGAAYRYSARWTLRMGVAYDQTPIPDAERRTPRIPGNDRRWVALGASYRPNDGVRLDLGYAHLFVSDTPIRNRSTQGHLLTGTYESSVDILGAQLVWETG